VFGGTLNPTLSICLQYKPGDEIDESEDENNEVLVEADDDSDTD